MGCRADGQLLEGDALLPKPAGYRLQGLPVGKGEVGFVQPLELPPAGRLHAEGRLCIGASYQDHGIPADLPAAAVPLQRTLLLGIVRRLGLRTVWKQIIRLQYDLLKNGINGLGIPDLIVAQNAIQNGCRIYALDRHFTLMSTVLGIELLELQAR